MKIGLLRPSTLPQLIADVVKFVEIVILRATTLPQVIVEVVGVGKVLLATLTLIIMEDMLIELDPGNKIPATIPLATV